MKASARAAALATGLAAGWVATPAAAQGRAAESVNQVTLSLDVRHDSNVVRSNQQRDALRRGPRADQRATPAVNVLISRPVGRNRLSINASAGYDFYRRNKRLNRERLSFGGNGTVMTGPLTFDLGATFSRRQSDPGDLTPLLIPGSASIRNTETAQDYSAQVRLGSQPYGFKPVASFGYSRGKNSNERRRFQDYESTRYGGGISYESPVLGYWDLQYLRSDTNYPNRGEILRQTGFTTERIALTGRRDLGAILVASGGVSWINLKSDQNSANVQNFKSVGYNLALTAVPTPDLQVTGSFSRDVSPSLGTDALYQIGNSYAVAGTYQVNRDMSFSLRGSIDDRHYEGAGSIFGIALTDSVQRSVTGTVSLAQSRRLGAAVDVGYAKRDANGTFFDYDSFYAGIRTTFRLGR